jgi:hypothetical protein
MTEKIEVTLSYSPDQLKDEIVERAAAQYVERLSYEHRQEFDKLMTKAIETKVNDILADVVTRVFQPMDVFGSPVGEPTTIMGVLAKKAETFLTEKVGSDGGTGSSYGEKVPRHEYVVKQVYEAMFHQQVKRDIEGLVKQAKDKAHLSIAAQVLETVKKEFSK